MISPLSLISFAPQLLIMRLLNISIQMHEMVSVDSGQPRNDQESRILLELSNSRALCIGKRKNKVIKNSPSMNLWYLSRSSSSLVPLLHSRSLSDPQAQSCTSSLCSVMGQTTDHKK
jgi:hypothetical protein